MAVPPSSVSSDPDPSPWSVGYTEQQSDTVVKLKSFIKQNLRHSNDSFHSTGSSDDNLSEVELTSGQQKMYQQYNRNSDRAQTPEPKPLTTSNVTLHDQIWSSDVVNTSQISDVKCRKLLRSSSEDLTDDRQNNRRQRTYFDSGSERSCDSQDTMILTLTDNQSHTYAFHNRISTQDGTCGSSTELFDIHTEMESDCIPIRRGGEPVSGGQEMNQTQHNQEDRNVSADMSLYAPKPFGSTSTFRQSTASATTKPKSKKNLKVSFANPLQYEQPPPGMRGRLEEDGDDGYGSTDNLSSETCSSNSSILNGAANPYQRPPLVHMRARTHDSTETEPSSSRALSTERPEEPVVAQKPPVRVKPKVLPKPKGYSRRQQNNREDEPSFKTNYGYVRLQRVPSFRKMNQELRKQKDLIHAGNEQVPDSIATVGKDIEVKDSTLQRKLKALCVVDDGTPEATAAENDTNAALEYSEVHNEDSNLMVQRARSTGHHQRTNSYEEAIREQTRPSQYQHVGMQNPSSEHSHHTENEYPPQTTNGGRGSTNNIDFVDGCYYYDSEEPPCKNYTYDQNAMPTKGILKKSKKAPQVSYSFDSYDQDRGFAISVHDQSQVQGQVQGQGHNQDFFQAASSIPQSAIPEHAEFHYGDERDIIRKEAQMEAEINGLYQYHPSMDGDISTSNPTPVHKMMLENERYRDLYNSSPSVKFLMEASQFAGDSYDTSDTLHRRQMRKATEQLYGKSGSTERSSSPQVTLRTRSPSPRLDMRTRSPSPHRMNQLTAAPVRTRSHSPSLRQAAESGAFSRMSGTPTGSMEEEEEEEEEEEGAPAIPLHRTDSINSTTSSSNASIYERYNVPLDNALLYKTTAAPNIRAQSPSGNSDTSTNVDSGFNDTFDGAMPTDGSSSKAKEGSTNFDTNVNRLQKAIKEGNRILSSTGLHILSSHKQQMDNEYSKYLKLLNQVQRQQQQHRRTSAPVISRAENPNAFATNRQQPMKAQFVKTADLYKMMEQQRRPPTPPMNK